MLTRTATTVGVALLFFVTWSGGCKKVEDKPPVRTNAPARRGFDPDNPGPSAAARAISQRIQLKMAAEAQAGGRLDEALKHYRKAAEVHPVGRRAVEAYLHIARIWERRSDHQRALAAYARAAALSPDNVTVMHETALAYEAAGRVDRAREKLARALKLAPDRLDLMADHARVSLTAGYQNEAIRLLKRFEAGRDETLKKLGEAGKPADRIPLLKRLMAVPDPKTARRAARHLADRAAEVRRLTAELLGGFAYRFSLADLERALKSEKDPEVKRALKEAVVRIRSAPRVEPPSGPNSRKMRNPGARK